MLVALIAAYGVVLVATERPPALPTLGLAQFAQFKIVKGVVAKAPSLYVVLDGAKWEALPPAEQREMLDGIGEIAAGAGYRGMRARTEAGVTVGQWLQSTGSALVPQHGTGPS